MSPFWRSIKYHLFSPLGLATIAAFFDDGDEIDLQDEHVEFLKLDDYGRMVAKNRLTVDNWDLYDTLHVIYRPTLMTPEVLAQFYWQSYRDFYRWDAIWQGSRTKKNWRDRFWHLLYSGAREKSRTDLGYSNYT